MDNVAHHEPAPYGDEPAIVLPRATAAPLVVATGVTLLAAGWVTSWVLSGFGGVLLVYGLVLWGRELLPERGEEEHTWVPAAQRPRGIAPAGVEVQKRPLRLLRRMQVPERVHPYSSGVRGGLVGGVAMAAVALGYGLTSDRGIWYPVNLLAAMLMPSLATASGAELEKFDATALVVGVVIHGVVSAGAGLFYGILLPTLPRWPILWGGVVAPLLWTGGIHSFMGVLNPVMNERVDWPWFIASQVVFGLVVGWFVTRTATVPVSRRSPDESPPGRRRG